MRRKDYKVFAMPKILFETTSGNIIGIVEEPDAIPEGKTRAEACQVKIGAIDRQSEFSKEDAMIVTDNLRTFVFALLNDERRKSERKAFDRTLPPL